MTIYYLMVKTHQKTGLQYLCQSTRKNLIKYKGSGKYWKLHLKKHGNYIDTKILVKCFTKSAIRAWGIYYSNLWSVVDSNKWANLKPEEGDGSTSETTKAIMNRPDVRAKTLAAQNTPEYKAKKMGDNNSSRRPEVRAKIAASVTGTRASKETKALLSTIQKKIKNTPEAKKVMSELNAGENNPRFNPTIYKFVHVDGSVETDTKFGFGSKHPELLQGHLSMLCRGLKQQYKGWKIEGDAT